MILSSIMLIIIGMAIPSFKTQLVYITRLSCLVLIYSGLLAYNSFYIETIHNGIGIYSGLFTISTISQLLDSFLLVIGAFILIGGLNIIILPNSAESSKYSLVILFSTLGSLFLISSNDLVSMYLSIELQSFGVYILSTLFRNSKSATSAGLTYFLLGGLSSCFILLGASLVYSYTGLTNLEEIYSLISVQGPQSLGLTNTSIFSGYSLGILFILIGFLFKVSAAPLHNWAPDVYDLSPTVVTTWLTIMPKIGILIFLLGFIFNNHFGILDMDIFRNLLLISSLLSLFIGTIVGLSQTKIKRLLAYSTISHIGFILLALSINSEQSIESFLFYIIQYSITNLNVFLIILGLGYLIYSYPQGSPKGRNEGACAQSGLRLGATNLSSFSSLHTKDISLINEMTSQFMYNPLLTISLSICLFSMAGIPPLIGFFSKQMVLYSAIQNGYYFMSLICILSSVISASYYLKIVITLFTNPLTQAPIKRSAFVSARMLGTMHSFLISTLTLIILLFILKPSILLNSTQLLALSLF